MLLDTPICDFGWKAPDFTLKNTEGECFTMSDYLGDKGLLIAFICNHCPYVQKIAKQLAKDAKLLMDEGINVFAIMSNDFEVYEEDSPINMKKFAKEYNFTFPYLVDENQSIGKKYGAICTPDFFGFNAKGELQYRGRLDNSGIGGTLNRVPELVNAMRLIANRGNGPITQHPSMGCSIKWRESSKRLYK